MKFLRYGAKGKEQPGVVDRKGNIRDLSAYLANITPNTLEELLALDIPQDLPLVKSPVRIGSCLSWVKKIICIGLNYHDHATEMGFESLSEPMCFLKSPSSLCGPYDDILFPPNAQQMDWEVELGIVIGKSGLCIPKNQAMNYIAGYCLMNDISERMMQIQRGGQWTKGKSFDTFGPMGPWLVTKEEIPNPHNLDITLSVNGKTMQNSHTSKMIFTIPYIVHYLSHFMSLHPGDVISTGSPSGSGRGQSPIQYLAPGDIVQHSIEGLGAGKQKCVAWHDNARTI